MADVCIDQVEDNVHEISLVVSGDDETVGTFVDKLEEFCKGYTWALGRDVLDLLAIVDVTQIQKELGQ